jgi:hypothetical protein
MGLNEEAGGIGHRATESVIAGAVMQQAESATSLRVRPVHHVMQLGRRIELQSMDPHFHDITIGLYEQTPEPGLVSFLAHSYSGLDGVEGRLQRIIDAMLVIGGMSRHGNDGRRLRHACGQAHRFATRRLFTEACKLKPGAAPETRPLAVADKTTGRNIKIVRADGGTYLVTADGLDEGRAQRIGAIGRGLSRLAQMELIGEDAARVRFACGQAHDALVGLLLPRALNLRAAMREQEEAMSRGMLVAPSAQKS